MAVRHLGSSLALDVDGVYGTLLCIMMTLDSYMKYILLQENPLLKARERNK